MFYLMGYNKDDDTYGQLATRTSKQAMLEEANHLLPKLLSDSLRDKSGEPYDWLEVWDEEDDNGAGDIVIGVMSNATLI